MKNQTRMLLSVLLCAVMAIGAVLPAFADELPPVEPTWQNTIESVTPVGSEPYVKLKLTPEGYMITECQLPRQYNVVFKDGTSTSVQIASEPSHFAPLHMYENYVDVETPDGTVTLYARVTLSPAGGKEAKFSVGQFILQGTLGDDGVPVAGSSTHAFPIYEEACRTETDEGTVLVRILYFFYSIYLKIQSFFVYHLGL